MTIATIHATSIACGPTNSATAIHPFRARRETERGETEQRRDRHDRIGDQREHEEEVGGDVDGGHVSAG